VLFSIALSWIIYIAMKHVLHVSETVDVLELGPCECYERSSEN